MVGLLRNKVPFSHVSRNRIEPDKAIPNNNRGFLLEAEAQGCFSRYCWMLDEQSDYKDIAIPLLRDLG